MVEGLGAEHWMPPPADETPATEPCLGSGGAEYGRWASEGGGTLNPSSGPGSGVSAEAKSSEAAEGNSHEGGWSFSDAGAKREAPSNRSSEPQEAQGAVAGEIGIEHGKSRSTASEAECVYEIKGSRYERRRYSRSEMEELRYVDTGEQQRRWKEVYQSLGPVIAQEYDGLGGPSHQKQRRKKKEASKIIGEVSTESTPAPACLDVQNLSDLVCANTLVGEDDGAAIEELCGECNIINDEDDSSDDEYDSIRRPAFLVEGEPDFESGPPLDGLEYLRRVRWEAARIPKVKVAKLNLSKLNNEQTPYMPNIPEIAECPPNLLPSKDWEASFLADFSEIRQAFSLLESSHDQPDCTERPDCTEQLKKTPTMSVILSMDTVSRAATLRNCISTLETESVLSRDGCLWLFALCVVVDTPLDAKTCASLRSLLRKCSSLLSLKSEPDDEVAMLSILVTIAGKYFGQSEK